MKHFNIIDDTYKDKKKTISVYNSKKHFGYVDNQNINQDVKFIFDIKKPQEAEIEITLFENCDINCSFCFHDKNSIIGLSKKEIFSKLEIIDDFVKNRHTNVKFIIFNIVGGEIFQNNLLDEYLPIYEQFSIEIEKICNKYNIPARFVWASNFLFKNPEKIKQFLINLQNKGLDSRIALSYDFAGRPTNNQYYKNVYYLEKYIISVCIVGTNEAMKVILKNDDDFFKNYLYKTFPIYLDDFIPDDECDDLIPTDIEHLNTYRFIAKNYPKIAPIDKMLTDSVNQMTCMSLNKITIFPDNSVSNCKWYRYKKENFNTYKDQENPEIYLDTAPQMRSHLEYYNCIECEFFKRCTFRCFTQWDFVTKTNKHLLPECWIKTFFKENPL